jgi:hypothetical protein
MTPELWVAVTIALISAIPALGALALGFVNRHALHGIHVEINSRLSELVAANSRAERAEGTAAGTADATAVRAMIDEAITKAVLTPPPDTLALAVAAAAKALLAGETRVVAGDLKAPASAPAESPQ